MPLKEPLQEPLKKLLKELLKEPLKELLKEPLKEPYTHIVPLKEPYSARQPRSGAGGVAGGVRFKRTPGGRVLAFRLGG